MFGGIFQNLDSPAYQRIITNHSWWEPREEAICLLLHSPVVIKGKESFAAFTNLPYRGTGQEIKPNCVTRSWLDIIQMNFS